MSEASFKLLAATGNPGKLEEIRGILADLDVTVISQAEFGFVPAEETGTTFTENALLKARHAAAETGLPVVADDSGLAVDALGGDPGVYSARYAGEAATDRENIDKLLGELAATAPDARAASFRCVAVFVASAYDPAPLVAEGRWEGRILEAPRGSGGFGYDPVFCDPVRGMTAAEMTDAQKNAVSHRGQAFRRLAAMLRERRVLGPAS